MEYIVTKKCARCKKEKSVNEFYKNKSRPDGLTIQCKICSKELHHETYLRHKDKIINQSRLWQINNRERYNARSREAHKRYRTAHPERLNDWINKNPHKIKEYNQRRRARLKGDVNRITAKEWRELLDFYGHKCLCCEKPESETAMTLDHVVPISKGGKNLIENAQPLCLSCNSKKHNKIIDYRINYVR